MNFDVVVNNEAPVGEKVTTVYQPDGTPLQNDGVTPATTCTAPKFCLVDFPKSKTFEIVERPLGSIAKDEWGGVTPSEFDRWDQRNPYRGWQLRVVNLRPDGETVHIYDYHEERKDLRNEAGTAIDYSDPMLHPEWVSVRVRRVGAPVGVYDAVPFTAKLRPRTGMPARQTARGRP